MCRMKLIPATGSSLPPFAIAEGVNDAEVLIGRSSHNDVPIDDDRISNMHVRVFRERGLWNVENISSVNRAYAADDSTEDELVAGFSRPLAHQETISLLVPRSRCLLRDLWFAYVVELSERERQHIRLMKMGRDDEVLDNVSVSMAASDRLDTKEWRSPFDTNPTFDTNDLLKIEKGLMEPEQPCQPSVKKSMVVTGAAVREHDCSTRSRRTELISKWDEIDTLYAPADESPGDIDFAAAMSDLSEKYASPASPSYRGYAPSRSAPTSPASDILWPPPHMQ